MIISICYDIDVIKVYYNYATKSSFCCGNALRKKEVGIGYYRVRNRSITATLSIDYKKMEEQDYEKKISQCPAALLYGADAPAHCRPCRRRCGD